MNRELITETLFQLLKSKLASIAIANERVTIGNDGTASIAWSSLFLTDAGVSDTSGTVFTKILSGTPNANEYLVDSNGHYTFALSKAGTDVYISYTFKGILSASRRLIHWGEVAPCDQPAMYLVHVGENIAKVRGIDSRRMMTFNLYVYVNTSTYAGVIPQKLMNPILDQIDTMFNVDNFAAYSLTLSDLVSHVAIQGDVMTDEGLLGDQAVSIIPIEILANA
jgi:hypothetical protein